MSIVRGILAAIAFLVIVPFILNAITGASVLETWHVLVLLVLSAAFGVWVARDGRLREPRSG